jgi:hypothetical protein
MKTNPSYRNIIIALLIIICTGVILSQDKVQTNKLEKTTLSEQLSAEDIVNGNLIQFNDNGAWCWYQDERTVVDQAGGKLIIGSDASGSGTGGNSRNGNIEAVIFDLQTRELQRNILRILSCDDHNTAAFLIRPDGKYLAFYAGHNYDNYSYYRIYDNGAWGRQYQFNWNTMPGGTDFNTTYSNLFYLSSENLVYNVARTDERSPNFIISSDSGDTWSYGGQLTEPDESIGYVNGYFKYSSNNINRIDFIATEHHPRDYNTSIYHGYIQGGQSFKSDGTLMDDDIFDKVAPNPADFTLVFEGGTTIGSMTMYKCWNADVQHYEDGSIAAIITARINNNTNGNDSGINPDHAFIYCRYNGTSWAYTYLCQAGKKMYSSEADYTGLGALPPHNPNTIYISTHIDPDTDEDITYREIFKGTTVDNGETWTWTPVTQRSNQHNFRPIIPKWNENNMALLWFRGIYNSAQNFSAAIVGIIERQSETAELMRYTDATGANTTLSDGSPLVTTGPDGDQGPADDQWHQRTGFGNGNSVLTSSETGGENAPVLKTAVTLPEAGTYDIWVNFWANPDYDWRIKAGLSIDNMRFFRQMACKEVEPDDHYEVLTLSGGGNTYLYQAYLGRIQISHPQSVDVFIDDEAIETGTENTLIGDVARTWYDGISYANLTITSAIRSSENDLQPAGYNLDQNYPNPFNQSTTICYSIPEDRHVSIKIYNISGQEIATLVNQQMRAGNHNITWNAENTSSGIYFYKLDTGTGSKTRKMILLK